MFSNSIIQMIYIDEFYRTFMCGDHLEFLRHFEVLFLKIHIFSLHGIDYQNMSLDQL
jgi:hypothetical protein